MGVIVAAACPPAWGASAAGQKESAPAVTAGYLENVTFEKLPGKERVTLTVSRQSGVTVESQSGNAVVVRLENLFVPEGLRRSLADPTLVNVLRVTPVQKAGEGRSWVLATIDLQQKVPFSVRQEGMGVLIDFNVQNLAAASAPAAAPAPAAPQAPVAMEKEAAAPKVFAGPRIFLDVQDADIRAVLRLLAEQGKVSIVAGDDVKGPVTVHLKDVPWEQALDTVLTMKGLDKKQEDRIITVMTRDRKKKEEDARIAAEAAQIKTADERRVREQKQNVEEGNLKKIAIEAKIVEVTTNFARELGVSWGYGYRDTWNNREVGLLAGSRPAGTLTTLPEGIGLTSSNLAVNFPSISSVAAPSIGVIAGSAQFVLAAKLSALETTGDGKVISSPKVTTLENEKATIWQGKKVPVVTPATSNNPPTVRYEDADLRLIVTPKITSDQGRISMEIDASNKDVDESLSVMGNPAINTSGVTSKVVVRDGDTIVVGGVYKTIGTSTMSGVPLLSQIPILGWLFKYEVKTQATREILIFITPRIIKDMT
jgi:type IV pilus assembly protein PilQ